MGATYERDAETGELCGPYGWNREGDHLSYEVYQSSGVLGLLEAATYELEALEAGMHGLTGEARALQNECWSAQFRDRLEIVKAALARGVPQAAIRAITYREI